MLQTNSPVTDTSDATTVSSPQPAWKWATALIFALLIACAAILRFQSLTRKPFWFDECFSVEVARLSWHDLVRLLWWREANMSLYYLLLRGWLHVGFSPLFIRSLSVLCSLATLPAIFWLGCKLFNRRVGLIAVALLSCNAYSIRYAQEARSYALFALLATLSSGFFAAGLCEPSRRNRWGYVATSVLAVYAHFFALLLIAAQWVSLRRFWRGEDRANIRFEMRRLWIAIGIAVLPLLAFVVKTGAGPIRWIVRPGFHDLLKFGEHLAGNQGWPVLLVYAAAGMAAVLPLGARRLRLGTDWEAWRVRFLLIWLFFPVALTVLISLARPVFLGRYFIFCLPALIILAAAGLASLRQAWMMAGCLAVVLLLSLQGTLSYYDHDFDVERDGSQAAANYIYDHARPGDAILFHIAEGRIPYEFFGTVRELGSENGLGARPEIVFPRHGDRLDYRDVTGKPSDELLRSLASRYERVWVVLMSNGGPGHTDATTAMIQQILGESFAEVEGVPFPQMEVRVYGK